MATVEAQKQIPFTRKNWILFGLGLLVILFGYVLLSIPPADGFWSRTMAPLLLITGYCVVIPIAILSKDERASDRDNQVDSD